MTHVERKWRNDVPEDHPIMGKISCKKCGWEIELCEAHIMTNYSPNNDRDYSFYHKWCWKQSS